MSILLCENVHPRRNKIRFACMFLDLPQGGTEPPTYRLQSGCSTTELRRLCTKWDSNPCGVNQQVLNLPPLTTRTFVLYGLWESNPRGVNQQVLNLSP